MIGQTISHYRILEELGMGGMGVVYKAEDTRLHRFVALKFLSAQLSTSEEERLRFLTEARAAAALNHPNIAQVYSIEEAEDRTFIVMEMIDGVELKRRISDSPLPLEDVLRITRQIAAGLQTAHDRGIVHRDIKSSNIMLTADGQVKIMDFGLAKMYGGAQVTRVGSTVGTAAYMSPEQARGDEVDQRTDIWSLGIVLYEMLSGQLPFRSEYEQAVIYSILNEDPEELVTIRPEVPKLVSDSVKRAMAKQPRARYSSAKEFQRDMEREADNQERSAQNPISAITRTRKTSWSMIALPGFLLAAVVLSFLLIQRGETYDSLAVLPFENVDGDESTEYLSDGITESLISNLSGLPALRVMSRSSVFRYKGNDTDPKGIGEQLGVSAVLSGRVQERGGNLIVSAELIDVSDNSQLWGGSIQQAGY